MCVKYVLQINLFEEIIAELAIYYVDMKNIYNIVAYATTARRIIIAVSLVSPSTAITKSS